MFEYLFENNAPVHEEKSDAAQTERIKAAVMERIAPSNANNADNAESEEKNMKHKIIRPLVIAAALTAVGAGSFVSANAANNGIVANVFTIFDSNEEENSDEWREVNEAGTESGSVVYYNLPDDKANSSDIKTETIQDEWSVVYYYTQPDDKADGSDLNVDSVPSEKWSEVYYYVPDKTAGSSDIKTETIQSGDWSVVYHTVTDEDEDVIYDYIFRLENSCDSK